VSNAFASFRSVSGQPWRPRRDGGDDLGIDLADPGFWDAGLDLVQGQLEAAEAAARESGRLSD
jgi:oligoendopeptidase F